MSKDFSNQPSDEDQEDYYSDQENVTDEDLAKLSNEEKIKKIQRQELRFRADSLNKEIKENLTDEEKVAVAIIGREISKHGLTTKEACQVANLPYDVFTHTYNENPTFRKVIDFKKLEYKRAMMKPLNQAVRKGDSKQAMQLLERLFPEEFGNEQSEARQNNLLREAIEFVRTHSDIEPLVKDGSGDGGTKTKRSPEEQKAYYENELSKLLT